MYACTRLEGGNPMLLSLQIENIAVIEKAGIEFDSGLNVLTGETGAGKSIVIDSINAVLGERASRDLVRSGSTGAQVSALFINISATALSQLEALGYGPDEDGMLLIQRQIAADGKGSCRINGQITTVSMLRSVGRILVNIHGQHENQALLSSERHVEYLDRMANLLPLRMDYQAAYKRLCSIRAQLEEADMDESMKARKMDMLRYQIEEIEKADLREGEMDELLSQRLLYRNAEKIADALTYARTALHGDEDTEGVLSTLSTAASALSGAGQYMEEAQGLSQRMENALFELQECGEELREYTSRIEYDPSELDEIENRLEQLRRLTGKYGPTETDVLAFLENARQELDAIETSDAHLARLRAELEEAEEVAAEKASALTEARKAAGVVFCRDVMEQLAFLDMPGVAIDVSIERAPLSSTGGDKVEFLIAANPGEPPKSIAKIASGGELSRIMLAIKSVLADVDDIDTLIFDEIDTGISGRAAQKVGMKLRQTAKNRQILCVTHLAQIAAQAHNQYLIAKSVRDGRTYTQVTHLNDDGRERELARIIGGEVTEAALQTAREMLKKVSP